MENQLKNLIELFYLISPGDHVCRHVSNQKKFLRNILGRDFESYTSKAHVSIIKHGGRYAEYVSYFEQDLIKMFRPFTVFVRDFKFFEHQNGNFTIYLDIVNKSPIREIFGIFEKITDNFTPHITIAKNLPQKDFEKSWKIYRHETYSGEFLCRGLTVLKRYAQQPWGLYEQMNFSERKFFNPFSNGFIDDYPINYE